MTNVQNGCGEVSLEVVNVTPSVAAEWLSLNSGNRPFSKALARKYADAMEAGVWVFSAESIKFGQTGRLLDGQHRLDAIIQSGRAQRMVIARGVSEDSFDVIDTGKPRSAGDQLSAVGEHHGNEIAGALNWIATHERTQSLSGRRNLTNQDVKHALASHPQVRLSAKVLSWNHLRLIPPSLAVALHYLMAQIDAERADAFWHALMDGTGLSAASPIFLLRNRMLKNRTANTKLGIIEIAALTIKTWNAYVEGRIIETLKWRRKGDKAESFPELSHPESSLSPNLRQGTATGQESEARA